MASDEFGKSVEFPQVSEFAEAGESYIDSPEFAAVPDEFAYPGTTNTSDNRKRGNMAALYYAAIASILMMVMNVTNGFLVPYTDPGPDGGQTQPTDAVVVPGGVEYKDVPGDETDPAIVITMAKTDGKTLYYTYVCALGQRMTPVSIHAAAYDEAGHEANPENDPDIWTSSRNEFEYTMDVSGLSGDLTLVLTGTFDKDGKEAQIVKVASVDDMALMPKTESYLQNVTRSGEVANIDYSAFFIFNENDPRMADYDLEATYFGLSWFDANKERLGGGTFVWDSGTVPEKDMIASAPGYIFNYSGYAHTDYAPDEAQYFAVDLRIVDNSTGKTYWIYGTPEIIPNAGSDIDMTEVFSEHSDWYNEKTGDYLHFGNTQGFRTHMIDSSVLFYRFVWSGGDGEGLSYTETYHQLDAVTTQQRNLMITGTKEDGYVLTELGAADPDDCYKPVYTVDYEGYAYMCHICDMDTCTTLADLNSFETMFEVQGAKFEISSVTFMEPEGHNKMIFYGDAGASWWPYDASFTYGTMFEDNPVDVNIVMTLDDEVRTSANSTVSGTVSAYIEYYGEGPMLVIRGFGPITHDTIFEWLGDVNKPSLVTSRTVGIWLEGTGEYHSRQLDPTEDPQAAAEALADSKFPGWTKIELDLKDTFLEYPDPNSQTQNPDVNNYHEEYVYKVS